MVRGYQMPKYLLVILCVDHYQVILETHNGIGLSVEILESLVRKLRFKWLQMIIYTSVELEYMELLHNTQTIHFWELAFQLMWVKMVFLM